MLSTTPVFELFCNYYEPKKCKNRFKSVFMSLYFKKECFTDEGMYS